MVGGAITLQETNNTVAGLMDSAKRKLGQCNCKGYCRWFDNNVIHACVRVCVFVLYVSVFDCVLHKIK